MKVAYLLGSLNRGGTETLVLDVFNNAHKSPFTFIGIHRKGGGYKEQFYNSKAPMYQLNLKHKFDIGYIFRLRKLLLKESITVVHSQQYIDTFYALIASFGTGIKVCQTFHGYDFKVSTIIKKAMKWSIKLSSATIFVTNQQKKYFQQSYQLATKNNLQVVHNGVNLSKLDSVVSEKIDLPALPTNNNETIVLGTVGNFVAGRDQLTICRFLSLLKKKGVDFVFYFVGAQSPSEPWRYTECVEYCKENDILNNVYFLGSRNDVPGILKKLDAFIYSTDHDTFGIAVIEAIASGIPTFVNDWEVMDEITNHGEWAILYQTKNENDLIEQFTIFLNNYKNNKEVYTYNANQVRQAYSIEQHINKLYSVYQML